MAETLKRSQLIQQQIEALMNNAPPPVSAAEREQIMKGRKKQADIDAGRAAIDARSKEVAEHTSKVDTLTRQLGEAQTQEGTSAEKAKREAGADTMKDFVYPGAAGAVGGAGVSYGINSIVGAGDKARTGALIEIGDEIGPTKDLTSSQMNRSRAAGAAKAAEKYNPTSGMQKAGNFAKRAGSYAVPIGFMAFEYKRYHDMANDESLPWEQRQNAARVANGFLGGFSGVGVEGAARFLNQKTAPGEGRAMMRIEAARDYANRMDETDRARATQPQTPSGPRSAIAQALEGEAIDITPRQPQAALPAPEAPTPPPAPPAQIEAPAKPSATPGSKAFMVEQAKGLGLKGTSKLTKSELAERLSEALAEHGGKRTRGPRLPKGGGAAAIGAALGYGMTPDSADAATGVPSSNGTDAAIGAGIGGGTAYGVSKLAEKLGPAISGTMGMAGEAMAPASIDAMTSYDDNELAQGRNALARNLPEALQFGAVDEARQMATVPEPNPQRQAGEGGYSPAITGRLSKMVNGGASPQQIASWLNAAMP